MRLNTHALAETKYTPERPTHIRACIIVYLTARNQGLLTKKSRSSCFKKGALCGLGKLWNMKGAQVAYLLDLQALRAKFVYALLCEAHL
jgi:hypothetical protein